MTQEQIHEDIKKYVFDPVLPKEFIDPASLTGSKAKETGTDPFGAKLYTLGNGVKVILYRNDIQKDRVTINISKNGGESLIPTEDMASFNGTIFSTYLGNTGVAGFSNTTVGKMLAGKNISVNPFINSLRNGIQASSTTKDVETALQLAYLYYTQPRFDEEEFNTGIKQLEAILPNIVNQPNYKFQKLAMKTIYNNHPRITVISPELLASANLATIEKNYRMLFADAAGVTAQIGSLPAGKKAPEFKDWNKNVAPGNRIEDVTVDMETPKTTVTRVYSSPIEYSRKKDVALDAAIYILRIRYTNTLREEEGGTYGAQSMADMAFEPKGYAVVQVYFDCKPELADKLREIATEGITKLATDGPTADEFDKALKNLEKNIPESREKLSYWAGVVRDYHRYGFNRDADYEAAVKSLTPQDIKDVLSLVINSGNYVDIVMRPGKTTE